jgi:hypothetical protein
LADSGSGVQAGSLGRTRYARLEYYDPTLHMPYASLHVHFLGTCKRFVEWIVDRLNGKDGADGARRGVGTFKDPRLLKTVVGHRLKHFVLRSTTTCGVCNFVEHLGAMTIAEMQLLVEVVMPYLVHDWVELGVPEEVVVMTCASRPHRVVSGNLWMPPCTCMGVHACRHHLRHLMVLALSRG